jgi:TrfA protein
MEKEPTGLVPATVLGLGPQMPLWDERSRGLPVTFARSALFSVGGKSNRRSLSKHTIASGPGAKLVYTGEELRTDDEDVLIQLFHLARGSNVHPTEGIALRFSGHAMLRELGWKVSKEGYERLKASLGRMQNGSLSSTRLVRKRKIVYSGQILRKFVLEEGSSRQQWCVWLEPEIRGLFDPDYALLSWSERMRLRRPIARWLHSFMATVGPDKVFVAPETAIFALSGSCASTMPKFRQLLKDALRDMQDAGLIFEWKISEGFIYVARATDQDINRATHAAALTYSEQQQDGELDEEAAMR